MHDGEDDRGVFACDELHGKRQIAAVSLGAVSDIAAAEQLDESAREAFLRAHVEALGRAEDEQALGRCAPCGAFFNRRELVLDRLYFFGSRFLISRELAIEGQRIEERGHIVECLNVNGNARIAERLFEISVEGNVRANNEIGLQGEDLLDVGLVDDADFLGLRRLLLDRLRQCLRGRLANDEVCAARCDEEIEVRSV